MRAAGAARRRRRGAARAARAFATVRMRRSPAGAGRRIVGAKIAPVCRRRPDDAPDVRAGCGAAVEDVGSVDDIIYMIQRQRYYVLDIIIVV